MDCSQAKSLFNAYLDEELSGSLAAEFAAHKLQCAACRRELALLEVMGHVVATDRTAPELSADFTDRLMACATALPPAKRRPWRRRLLYIGGPLAAAACVLLAVNLFQPPQKQVLSGVERVNSAEEMLRQVEQVRLTQPDNPELAALEKALRERVDRIAEGTEESTRLLENFGKMTIMEILDSIQLDASRAQPAAPPSATTSGVDHAPPAEDL